MGTKFTLKAAVVSAAVLSLAGCLGNGSSSNAPAAAPAAGGAPAGGTATGGGTTGGATGGATGGTATGGATAGGTLSQAAFDTKAQSYLFLVPTTTPLSGSADYTGNISMLTQANPADAAEALVGDLKMKVDFGSGVVNPVTATAGNFAGNVNGAATTVAGTLSTANAVANDINTVVAQSTAVGTLTSANATLRGTLADPTGALSGDARMILNGSFKEANGAKIAGGHQTTITPGGGAATIGTGGSLYADRK